MRRMPVDTLHQGAKAAVRLSCVAAKASLSVLYSLDSINIPHYICMNQKTTNK
jgi:hypothetical protein